MGCDDSSSVTAYTAPGSALLLGVLAVVLLLGGIVTTTSELAHLPQATAATGPIQIIMGLAFAITGAVLFAESGA